MKINEKDLFAKNIEGSLEKLKKAKVCIIGLGGLGSNVAVLLARAGLGHLGLIDYDRVEASNLNRQQYRLSHIDMKKTQALESIIKEINPFIELELIDAKVDEKNLISLTENIEIIVEALDDAETKAMLTNKILTEAENKILIVASGMAGINSANDIVSKKIRNNFYVVGDGQSDCELGLMSTRVMLCAAHQANLVLRIILEKEGK